MGAPLAGSLHDSQATWRYRCCEEDAVLNTQPNTTYTFDFTVEFASDAADGLVGIGGPPGEAVYIKAGASPVEPMKILTRYRLWF